MTSAFAAATVRTEDVLSYLPATGVAAYGKGEIIYGPGLPTNHLYMIVTGAVKLSGMSESGDEVLVDIIRPEEIFGQPGFLPSTNSYEQATALASATLMSWPVSALEEIMARRPRLAVALLQIFAQRSADLTQRMESLSNDNVERRLIRSLLHFSHRLGTAQGGDVHLMPLTHYLLARHIGTSREIVSHYMNRFRDRGYLRYSRQEIVINRDALTAAIAIRPK